MTDMVLKGIRVIDWSNLIAAPAAAVWLGALGADVIHVEQPVVGDLMRTTFGIRGIPCVLLHNRQSLFETFNYNKKSMTVNLKKDKGREIIYQLIRKSDVFITNHMPNSVLKVGLDYETLLKHNPKIIYGSTTVNGPKGPAAHLPGLDTLGQARAGTMMTSGEHGQPPTLATIGMSDDVSAFALTCGIITALYHRERTGIGQRVDSSQLQAVMNICTTAFLGMYLLLSDEQRQANKYGGEGRAIPRDDELNPAKNHYRCKDGRWIMLGGFFDRQWTDIAKAIGRADLAYDPKFSTMENRQENRRELIRILDDVFASKTLEEWQDKFIKTDIPFCPVNQLRDIPADPQVIANDYLFTFAHPDLGRIQIPGMPFTLEKTPGTIRVPAPTLGQHNQEILLELGYSREEIDAFIKEEVIDKQCTGASGLKRTRLSKEQDEHYGKGSGIPGQFQV